MLRKAVTGRGVNSNRRNAIAAGLLTAGLLAGCETPPAGTGAQAPTGRDFSNCTVLFEELEEIEELNLAAGPVDFYQQQVSRIRQYDCLTLTRKLTGMEAVAESLIPHTPPTGGRSIGRVAVQVGVVTSTADDARSLAFFESLGYRARSVGASGLGRKIYVEATNEQQLSDVISIAQQAGFVGSYPSRFVLF